MAYSISITCATCGEDAQIYDRGGLNKNQTCDECIREEEALKRKAHFEALDKLSIEERIRLIETWIYDYRPPVSMRDWKF